MDNERRPVTLPRPTWMYANTRLLPSGTLMIIGAIISAVNGKVRHGDAGHKLLALIGVALFLSFAIVFLRLLTTTIYRLISHRHLSPGRASAIKFVLRAFGYAAIFLTLLELVGIPVGNLLLGGAAIGIILGVAAQQALANFFASIVLIIAHPFSVGDHVTFTAGGLGGAYTGKIKDIGLTHTKLVDDDGDLHLFPNAALLSGATITTKKSVPPTKT